MYYLFKVKALLIYVMLTFTKKLIKIFTIKIRFLIYPPICMAG